MSGCTQEPCPVRTPGKTSSNELLCSPTNNKERGFLFPQNKLKKCIILVNNIKLFSQKIVDFLKRQFKNPKLVEVR
jgi:hypothetical protein